MYISHLYLDLGQNPDRPRPARNWLRNIYRVHQRLCMAFPTTTRKENDPFFLRPFDPKDIDEKEVHVPRSEKNNFLFRIDLLPSSKSQAQRAVIVVQSATKPDWEYAFANCMDFLCAPPYTVAYNPQFSKGQTLRFKLVANPTKKIGTVPKNKRISSSGEKSDATQSKNGKRVPVPVDHLKNWLLERADRYGFKVDKSSLEIVPGYVNFSKGKPEHDRSYRLRSVLYKGILEVTDPDKFRKGLITGIGPGKGFGFGLLSVCPVECQKKR